ncbi:unnamed protein product [Colias eurytheme]|nr:unnamed protein product [Colias eurytheme]
MDPDSFMTIYGTFRRGSRPALGFQATNLGRPPSVPSKKLYQAGAVLSREPTSQSGLIAYVTSWLVQFADQKSLSYPRVALLPGVPVITVRCAGRDGPDLAGGLVTALRSLLSRYSAE